MQFRIASSFVQGTRVRFEPVLVRNLLVAALALLGTYFGVFRSLDHQLQEVRFQLLTHPASGTIAVVEIDSSSLQSVGVWPWPRALHGQLLDRLMAMGARSVIYDVDFSASSNPANDAAFAAALKRAGERVALAAFEQNAGAAQGVVANIPTRALGDQVSITQVDVPADEDGALRDYMSERSVGPFMVPSAAARIAGAGPPRFGIDFGVDLDTIDRISASDVLAGTVQPERVRGRDILIGATAQELRDLFQTPRYGVVPGVQVHALAAETLRQGLALRDWPFGFAAFVIFALALLASVANTRGSRPAGLLVTFIACGALELFALVLQHFDRIRAETAGGQVALVGFFIVGILADVRLRRQLHAQAARERDAMGVMLSRVVEDNFDGVVIVDGKGAVVAASRLAQDLLGKDLEGQDALAILPTELALPVGEAIVNATKPAGAEARIGEITLPRDIGGPRVLEYVVTVSTLPGGEGRLAICLTFRDITERRAHERRLDYLARHDEMTGAWTRLQLMEQIDAYLGNPENARRGLTILCLNLRRFVLVNDVFGRKMGDALLNAVVERLRDSGLIMLTRLGGDSFACAVDAALDSETLATFGQALADSLGEPYEIRGRKVIVGASAGGTTTSISGTNADMLLSHASMAQATAKRRIGEVFQVFSPEMETLRRDKQSIDTELRHSIADGSLALVFQPKVDLASGRLVGAEALMRWQDTAGTAISPSKFIPIAEESGLIVELGRWALIRGCQEAASWPDACRIAINVSPVQFALSDVVAEVTNALAVSGLPPQRLEIEITESLFVDSHSSVGESLERLRALGVTVALDDFGTGYSSLHYLARLPIDTIKIDQSFTRRLIIDPAADATVQAIVSLARAHRKHLVAEGIETLEQAELLRHFGCDVAQGYLYGRPESAKAFRQRFSEPRTNAA